MRTFIFTLIAVVSVNMASAQTGGSSNKVITNLSAERFRAASGNDKNGILLDLRTTDELLNKGYLKGAIQLDYLAKDAEAKIDKLDKNKTYYVYCASGRRSLECAEYMEKSGFKRVYNLEKGFNEWITKGFPIEKR
ncbi:MAG TPA: rhodanese-like domain-containing protein [Bacteroidia bacterium]